MGLKDLKSNLDLLGGFGNEGETLGGMETFNPNNFQKGIEDASQKHIDSLQQVPGGDSNSPFQDMDGELGPQFQRDTTAASQAHINSLQQVPGGDSNSPYQDMNGELGPQFQKDTAAASQAHISTLSHVPGGDSSSPFQDRSNGATPTQYLDNLPN